MVNGCHSDMCYSACVVSGCHSDLVLDQDVLHAQGEALVVQKRGEELGQTSQQLTRNRPSVQLQHRHVAMATGVSGRGKIRLHT